MVCANVLVAVMEANRKKNVAFVDNGMVVVVVVPLMDVVLSLLVECDEGVMVAENSPHALLMLLLTFEKTGRCTKRLLGPI